MSADLKSLEWVRSLDLSASERSTLYALIIRANGKGQCFPKLETLAEDAGPSRRTVCRHLKKFKKMGIVTWDHGTGHNPNTYYIHEPRETNSNITSDDLTDNKIKGISRQATLTSPSSSGGNSFECHERDDSICHDCDDSDVISRIKVKKENTTKTTARAHARARDADDDESLSDNLTRSNEEKFLGQGNDNIHSGFAQESLPQTWVNHQSEEQKKYVKYLEKQGVKKDLAQKICFVVVRFIPSEIYREEKLVVENLVDVMVEQDIRDIPIKRLRNFLKHKLTEPDTDLNRVQGLFRWWIDQVRKGSPIPSSEDCRRTEEKIRAHTRAENIWNSALEEKNNPGSRKEGPFYWFHPTIDGYNIASLLLLHIFPEECEPTKTDPGLFGNKSWDGLKRSHSKFWLEAWSEIASRYDLNLKQILSGNSLSDNLTKTSLKND